MSFKRFISGVCAFAVAVTVFAAVAVTASATEYKDISVTPGTLSRAQDKGDGTFTIPYNNVGGGASSYVVADLSGLSGIEEATSVEINFTAKIPAAQGKFGKLMYGVGNKTKRGLICGNSSAESGYDKSDLFAYFGSEEGSYFNLSDNSTNYLVNQAGNKDINVKITLTNKRYTCLLTIDTAKARSSNSNIVYETGDPIVIEAFTWGTQTFDLTFKNIKVTYTVPGNDGIEINEVTLDDPVPTENVYARAFTAEIDNGTDMITNVKVDVPDKKPQKLSFDGGGINGPVSIGIILASKTKSNIENIVPKVTVNAE